MLAGAGADDGSGGLVRARAALWADWLRRQTQASGNTVACCCKYEWRGRRIGRLEGFGMQANTTDRGSRHLGRRLRLCIIRISHGIGPRQTRRGQGRQARVALTD